MAAIKAVGLALILSSGTCGGSSGSPPPASYSCVSASDVSCRYQAEVVITGGTLQSARIMSAFPDEGSIREARIEGLSGTVTISDRGGEVTPVTCDFAIDYSVYSESQDGITTVSIEKSAVFDEACPVKCPWFLPGEGEYEESGARYGISMFEGQWELGFGDQDPESPEVTHPVFWTLTSSVEFLSDGVELQSPVVIADGGWSTPLAAPMAGTVAQEICDAS